MNRKAFTLIELLVVVAIIGILAAVGVVAYNGYTSGAKVIASKTNHNNTVKEINLTIHECNINGSVSMMSDLNNKKINNINCYGNQFLFFADKLINHVDNNGRWKNPYKASGIAFTNWGTSGNRSQQPGWCSNAKNDSTVGFVWINSRTGWDNVTVCTCNKIPCSSSDNRLENKIYLED